jgi:ABC-type amino acid transport substrate-binding protein
MRPIALTLAVLAASVAVAAAGATGSTTTEPGVLTVGIELGQPGFAVGTLANPTGFSADLARAVAKQLGLRIHFVRIPFGELFLPGGTPYDVAFQFATILPARKKVVDFSVPYSSARLGALLSRGTPEPKSLAQLRKLPLCAKQSTTGLYFIQDHLRPQSPAHVYLTGAEAFAALAKGVCHAFVFDLPALMASKKQSPGRYGDIAGKFGPVQHYGAVLPKGSALTAVVNVALRPLIKEGVPTRIANKYFGPLQSVPELR